MDKYTSFFSILLIVGVLFTAGCLEKEESKQPDVKETSITETTLVEEPVQPTAGDQTVAAKIDPVTASFSQESYTRVEEIVDMGEPALPKLYAMLSSEKLDERWASSYALSRIAHKVSPEKKQEIIAHLRPVLNDSNPSVRQTAAGVLTAQGVKDGIPVLIEYLDSEETYYMSDPPELLSEYSFKVLNYYTVKDFGYNVTSWNNWWAESKGKLVWDQNMGVDGGYVE